MMMSTAYGSIMRGLEEIKAHNEGAHKPHWSDVQACVAVTSGATIYPVQNPV